MIRILVAISILCTASVALAQTASSAQPIVNGRSSNQNEMLGTVGILDASSLQLFCSGTLVSPGVVVTAAHCFFDQTGLALDPTTFVVAFGQLDLTTPPPATRLVTVLRGEAHPGYVTNPIGDETAVGLDPTERDVGFLVLGRDLVEVTPIPIATSSESSHSLDVGTVVELEGFGVNDLTTLSYGVLMQAPATIATLTDNEMLISPVDTTQGDTCYGDSGGPAYLTIDGTVRLVGITSRGRLDSTVECGAGGIYTLASDYRSWIAHESGDPRVAPKTDSGRCEASEVGRTSSLARSIIVLAAIAFARSLRRIRGC